MKVDKEFLIKHHFWLLTVLTVPLLLLAFVGLTSGVSDAIAERQKAISDSEAKLKGASPKSVKLSESLDKNKRDLEATRTIMWKANWEKQKHIFTWPKGSPSYARLEKELRFGDPITNKSSERSEFLREDNYKKLYDELRDILAPTQLGPTGDYLNVLTRYVQWDQRKTPTSEEIWLALEDYWVYREILKTLADVNKSVATFTLVGDAQNVPPEKDRATLIKAQIFRSRLWELEIRIVEKSVKGAKETWLRGRIKNLTDRVLPLSLNNKMVLNVWFDPSKEAQPVPFVVQGEQVKADETLEIPESPEHRLQSLSPQKIFRVEQVFDTKTVPIKRLDQFELFYGSSRTWSNNLKMTAFSEKIVEEESQGSTTASGSDGFGGPTGPGGGPMGPGFPGGPGGPGGSSPFGPGGGPGQASSDFTPNGISRKRYVERTVQVRRMPLAIVLTMDQAFLQDLMVALPNSELRLQVTQQYWRRISANASSPTGVGNPGAMMGPGDEDGGINPGRPGGLSGPPRRPGPPGGPLGPGPMGPPGVGSGYPGGPGTGMQGGSALTGLARETPLIQVTIYATASLYEAADKPKEEGSSGTTSTGPGTTTTTPPANPSQPKLPSGPGGNPAPQGPNPNPPTQPQSPAPQPPNPINPANPPAKKNSPASGGNPMNPMANPSNPSPGTSPPAPAPAPKS